MRLKASLWLVAGVMIFSSCVSNKKVVYLQDEEGDSGVEYDQIIEYDYPEYQLHVGDILKVEVRSSDPMVTAIYQGQMMNGAAQLANSAADINYMTGYTINANGDIEIPLVGHIQVENLTVDQAKDSIASKIRAYIKDPYVLVRLGGIPFIALGEFNRPGRYSVLKTNLTILEAIASAGDLNVVANRKEVNLIRQYREGQKMHKIDLTDRSLINSPMYYIQPNDQLYVPPLKVREIGGGVGVTGFQTFVQTLSVVSSALLIIVSVINLSTIP
ncbi:MAG: polysaccharide biosynthesis/export family protein [Cyclobacteriaceae bacterium]